MKLEGLSAKEYKFWANYYYERFGWFTSPKTCKCKLNKKIEIEGNTINCIDGSWNWNWNWNEIGIDINETCRLAEEYENNLTGIGLLLEPSNIVVIDFDDIYFYEHWIEVFGFKTKTSVTQKGFHSYFRVKKPFHKILNTSYYDVLGIGSPILPPSPYYKKLKRIGSYLQFELKPLGKYNDLHEFEIVEIDSICETGLVPEKIESSNKKVHELIRTERIDKIKIL